MTRGWLRGVLGRSGPSQVPSPADVSAALERAVALHREGRLAEACAGYEKTLELQPGHFDALHLSGVAHYQMGAHEEALRRMESAAKMGPQQAPLHSNLGLVLQQLGRLEDALTSFDQALSVHPGFADALFNRGNVLRDLGRQAEAAESYQRLIAARPDFAQALNNLGLVLGDLHRSEEALQVFERALALRPDHAETHNNRGTALCALGRYEEALAAYERAVALKPDYAGALNNHGATLGTLLRHEEALDSYERAIQLDPDHAEAFYNKAVALSVLRRHEAALAAYDRAIAIRPGYAEAWNGRGTTLKDLQRHSEALESYGRALEARAEFPEALDNLGVVLASMGRHEEALARHEAALRQRPDFGSALTNRAEVLRETGDRSAALDAFALAVEADPSSLAVRFKRLVSFLPILPVDEGEVIRSRVQFAREIALLAAWSASNGHGDEQQGVGAAQPFHLAYQEEDNRELLARYGSLCAGLMRRWQERNGIAAATRFKPGRPRLRLGIVSAHIHSHSVWNAIVKGWLEQIDQRRFEIDVYHLGTARDAQTEFAAARSSNFVQGDRTLKDWVAAIGAREPDVLIYPEIGMDIMTPRLACLRLAPVQIAAWGHPETTGLPTIDHYLSAECFETAASQAHYTENLVALPNLGCYYAPENVAVVEMSRYEFGLDERSPLFVCPGTPFKYAPGHDRTIVEIARRVRNAQFVFFTYGNAPLLSRRLGERIANAFRGAGLDASQHIAFIPWQPRPAFFALLRQADAFLDTIGFSGFNTAMQAIECGLPIVTREGRYLRGRFGSAILKRIGLDELVSGSDEAYVEAAVRVVTDPGYRERIRERIRVSREILYRDLTPIRALEAFLSALKPGTPG